MSLLPPLAIAFVRATRHGMIDPLAIFAACFSAYNGVLLLRLNYGASPHRAPFAIDGAMFFHAAILSALGSLGLVAGWLLSHNRRQEPRALRSSNECTASFLTGCVFYLIGIGLYMAVYAQLGGYMQSVAMDRGRRFEMLTGTLWLPYQGFVISGLSLMVYASIGAARFRLLVSSIACLIWFGLVLLQGDRRLVLQMMLALAIVVGTLRPNFVKLRPLALVALAGVYFIAVMFGEYRELIYDLAAGRSTLKQARVIAGGEDQVSGKPEDTELGGPYMSVLYYSSGTEPLRWGRSYLMALPAFLPKALYPGTKDPGISAEFDQTLYEGAGPVYGWGFSPIAEAYANFGPVGPLAIMTLWTICFAWLGSHRYRSLSAMVVCATLLQEAVNANRIDFRSVYIESVYCTGIGLIAVATVKAIAGVTDRSLYSHHTTALSFYLNHARRSKAPQRS